MPLLGKVITLALKSMYTVSIGSGEHKKYPVAIEISDEAKAGADRGVPMYRTRILHMTEKAMKARHGKAPDRLSYGQLTIEPYE